MKNLLYPSQNQNAYIFTLSKGQTLAIVSKLTGVPVEVIILDNNLKKEPKCGNRLIIKPRKSYFVITVDTKKEDLPLDSQTLLKINNAQYFYVGQHLIVEK